MTKETNQTTYPSFKFKFLGDKTEYTYSNGIATFYDCGWPVNYPCSEQEAQQNVLDRKWIVIPSVPNQTTQQSIHNLETEINAQHEVMNQNVKDLTEVLENLSAQSASQVIKDFVYNYEVSVLIDSEGYTIFDIDTDTKYTAKDEQDFLKLVEAYVLLADSVEC